MKIPVSEAKGQLTELVRRAESGEEVILTRHGQPIVRLAAIRPVTYPTERRALLLAVQDAAARKLAPGPGAARCQDFLYGDDGLPR